LVHGITSFANPAVTIARSMTNTFAGVRPADVAGFVAAQMAAGFAATLLFRWLLPGMKGEATEVLVKQERE
jgi:glycerol uptake facilitator-like aquaporin